MTGLDCFREIWFGDFEFRAPDGERPEPHCLVAREWRTGQTIRLLGDELRTEWSAPFPTDSGSLFVAYYASAEMGCFLALDWPMPERVLDLFCEFRNLTNGLPVVCGNRLLGALAHFGIDAIESAEKEEMRGLAMRGEPFTQAERAALLDYCESDVVALAKLLPAMLPTLDLSRALIRGRYMQAAARMEWTGTPIDLELLREHWAKIKGRLIREVDRDYRCFVPTGRTVHPDVAEVAVESGVDPFVLSDAVDQLWAERGEHTERSESLRAARKATGLTAKRIARLEDTGVDSSSYGRLDEVGRELAESYPELGIDDDDHAGSVWELLREPADKPTAKPSPETISQAVSLVRDNDNPEYDGPLSFSVQRFAEWLIRSGIPWPRLESGALDLSDSTFREMSRAYPAVSPLRELRHALGQLRLNALAVGQDGRNRCLLSALGSKTGRNQPSNSRYIFGPSVWLRGLIQPESGRAVAYLDWSQQEFAIAAVLSGDPAMIQAYESGDPYLSFAQQAGAVPRAATKQSHRPIREMFKTAALAVLYGMESKSLAQRIGQPESYARELLRLHHETFPRFWAWSQAAVDHAMLAGSIRTVFGWTLRIGPNANPRSLANFPMQAHGAEMLRLACCLATERGIEVCAPVHDAILIEADAGGIEAVAAEAQAAMAEASRVVLDGFELRTDAEIVRHPERYSDPRGERMWGVVMGILGGLTGEKVLQTEAPRCTKLKHPVPLIFSPLSLVR